MHTHLMNSKIEIIVPRKYLMVKFQFVQVQIYFMKTAKHRVKSIESIKISDLLHDSIINYKH